jgi:hypothetical protein
MNCTRATLYGHDDCVNAFAECVAKLALAAECDASDCDGLYLWADETQANFVDCSSVKGVADCAP